MTVYYKLPKSKRPEREHLLSGVVGIYTACGGSHWCFVCADKRISKFPKDNIEIFCVTIEVRE